MICFEVIVNVKSPICFRFYMLIFDDIFILFSYIESKHKCLQVISRTIGNLKFPLFWQLFKISPWFLTNIEDFPSRFKRDYRNLDCVPTKIKDSPPRGGLTKVRDFPCGFKRDYRNLDCVPTKIKDFPSVGV